ncbi:MAG: DUF72 domain-containing protein [Methanobacteriota archaeon]|nr:MAG: DUF72 domain-containing protein [Euryarchaeota archaeon]
MSAAVELRIGCVGYSYDFWVGPFYPRHTPQSEFLKLYSKVFDLVEIDSTFYTIPPPATIRSWRDSVPDSFSFAAKLPRVITHENAMRPTREALDRFYRSIGELRPKVATLLVQLPPFLHQDDGMERVLAFLDGAPRDYRYAVEFRHSSWMRPEVFDALRRREVALVWNEVQYLNTLPEITADFVYLRFIGDRSLSDLGRLQIDRTAEMEKWAARLRSVQDRVARAFVLFNNHFAGFGPACADQFRRILGLPGVDFAAIHTPEHGQKRLLEFGGPES